MRIAIIIVGIHAVLLPGRSVQAHHSFSAEFDASKKVNLRGVVTRVEWINPHTWIHLDVKGPEGEVSKWMIEGGSPNSLFRRGVTKASFPLGIELIVEGYQARSMANRASGREITLPDGKKFSLGAASADAPQ